MRIKYTRHRKSLPWLRSSRDGFIYEGIFQIHRVHTGDRALVVYHITIGPFSWAAAWRRNV